MLFVSCYFGALLFSDPNADPNGSGQRKGLYRTGEDIAHRLCRLELGVGGDVGVGVQRETCGVVTQHRGHGLHVHAVLQGHRREGVAEIVESDAGQPCPFQHPLEHVQDAVRGHGASGWRWEYPFAVTRFSSLLHQNAYRVCRQRQGAVGVFCF